jgi:BMFP domain-containing protein YqiC
MAVLAGGFGSYQEHLGVDNRRKNHALTKRVDELETLMQTLTRRVTELEAALKARDEAEGTALDLAGRWT